MACARDGICTKFAWFDFWEGEEYFEVLKSGYDDQILFKDNFMKKLYLYELLLAYPLATYYYKRGNKKTLESVQSKIPKIENKLDMLNI